MLKLPILNSYLTSKYAWIGLHAVCLMLGAFLLFWVELLFAKQILPYLGGNPVAWNGCMVFFQVVLLLGYAWSFLLQRLCPVPWQKLITLGLFVGIGLCAPYVLHNLTVVEPSRDPLWWLFVVAGTSLGLPFFALASLTPTLQNWLAAHKGINPYFLYAASNLGSLLGLLCFPVFLQPNLTLSSQQGIWGGLYWLVTLGLLGLTAGNFLARTAVADPTHQENQAAENVSESHYPTWRKVLLWFILSLIPASLLLSVTAHITVDLAPVPLLWAIPLMLYLLSFILVFAPRPILCTAKYAPLIGVGLSVLGTFLNKIPIVHMLPGAILVNIGMHLAGFLVIALICHSHLCQTKPTKQSLGIFYLVLAFGGMCGGILNSLVAPYFLKGHYEYAIGLVVFLVLSSFYGRSAFVIQDCRWLFDRLVGLWHRNKLLYIPAALLCGVPLGLLFTFVWGPVQELLLPPANFVQLRSIFASYTIRDIAESTQEPKKINWQAPWQKPDHSIPTLRLLANRTTIHGGQYLQPSRRGTQVLYYAAGTPINDVFATQTTAKEIAILGLGTGGMAGFVNRGQNLTFYELDPLVPHIAQEYFTYLDDARAKQVNVNLVIGDGRLKMTQTSERYDLLLMDAFSSDAIPMHLLTREAFAIYRKHLKPGGIICVHISNRYVDLEPVLKGLAADIPGWHALQKLHRSHWVALLESNNQEDLNYLRAHAWTDISQNAYLWTDDHADLLRLLRLSH